MNRLLIAQIVFLLLVAGFGLFHWKHEKVLQGKWINRFPQLAIVAEVLVLLVAVVLTGETLLNDLFPASQTDGAFPGLNRAVEWSYVGILVFPFVLLYLRLSRLKYLGAVLIPAAVLVTWLHRQEAASFTEMVADLEQYPPAFAEALTPKVWISQALYGAGRMVLIVAPFVVAALAMGRVISRKRFVIVAAVTQLVIQLITSIYGFGFNFLVNFFQVVTVTSLAMLMFELPYLRRGIDAFIGDPVEERKKADFSTSVVLLLQYSFMLVFGFCLTGSVFVNREIKAWSEKAMNPKPMYHSPAEVDGLTLLKETVYTKDLEEYIQGPPLNPYFTLSSVIEAQNYKSLSYALDTVNMTHVDNAMKKNSEPIALFENTAKEADYFGPIYDSVNGYNLDLLRLREVSHLILGRAMIRMQAGQTDEALEDIHTVYKFASLLHENQMIATSISSAMKKHANDAAWNFMVYYQDDSKELEKLAIMVDKDARYGRQSFPFDAFLHYEPSTAQTLSIGYLVGLGYPGIERYYRALETTWSQYDQLQLTVALFRYHHQYGHWPEMLEELSPEFLKRIPLEPQNGDPYIYTHGEKVVTIKRPLDSPAGKNGKTASKNPPEFPYPVGGELGGAGE